jgi:translation initiation factor RLI1
MYNRFHNSSKYITLIHVIAYIGDFSMVIEAGEFTDSEIIVMLGENGTGKTTFIRMLAGRLEPDAGCEFKFFELWQTVRSLPFRPQKPCFSFSFLFRNIKVTQQHE